MATYLLLRNNKEEGPLSLQHLIQLGLKPYDLVWVQGKSAAWRYPSEIPELKPYAAAVEEQPFDRFYKKPGATKETVETVVPAEPVKQPAAIRQVEPEKIEKRTEITFPGEAIMKPEIIKENVPAKSENWAGITFPEENNQPQPEEIKHEKYYPKKTVYVTMPMQQMHEPKYEQPVFNIHSSPVTNTHEEPVVAQTKYSQPLDEIKEMYVKKLQDRKQQSAKKKFIAQSLKRAAVFIGIISMGVLIGFAIKPKSPEKIVLTNSTPLIEPETTNAIKDEPQTETVLDEMPSANANKTMEKKIEERKLIDNPAQVQKPYVETNEIITEKKNTAQPKQKQIEEKDIPVSNEAPRGVEINNTTGERIKQTRGNNIFRESNDNHNNTVPQKSLKEFVTVKSNDYHIVAFGGIRNLQLTVNNDSKYSLDNVLVEVKYLKPNGLPLKDENVYFKSVAPNGSLTIRVPDTNRGMKVTYKVIKIDSKEFKSDMAGI